LPFFPIASASRRVIAAIAGVTVYSPKVAFGETIGRDFHSPQSRFVGKTSHLSDMTTYPGLDSWFCQEV
jgi:hypothetical protein